MATASIRIEARTAAIAIGDTLQLQATPLDAAGAPLTDRASQVTWSVDPPAVAEVSATGLLVGRAGGYATVTAAHGGASASLQVAVNNPVPQILDLAPSQAFAGEGAFTLRVSGHRFAPGSVVRWNGEALSTTFVGPDELDALVLPGHLLYPDTADVRVVTGPPGGGMGGRLMLVLPAVARIAFSPESATVAVGDTVALSARSVDPFGRAFANAPLRWESSAPAVAAVAGFTLSPAVGVAQGLTPGIAYIIVTSGGRRDSARITVR